MEKNNNVITKQMPQYQQLLDQYKEMNDYLLELIDEHKQAREDIRYMHDFIRYKNLNDEFSYFKEHAHEDTDTELPFPYLVL